MEDAKSGEKPLALLIPGLDGTGRLFYRQLKALEGRYRVRPWAYRRGADFDLADLTGDLGRETAGEAPGSILVIAESFGGLVALDYVLQYPERVRHLMLVNSFPYCRRRLRIRLACILVGLLRSAAGRRVKDLIVDQTLLREGILAEDRQHYREIVKQIDLPGYRRRLQLVQETDLRPRLANITVPTVLFASGRDKVVPSVVEAHFMAKQIAHAQVHEFPEAGHALLLTPGFSLADYDDRMSEKKDVAP
jgi:pimeloyl-ACP methyl ester carboxylesterase